MRAAIIAFVSIATLLTSCENKTETGALAGGALGAGTGALISPTVGGVVIGAAVGAAAGGLVGAALDEQDRKIVKKESPQTMKKIDRGEQLSLNDIEKMSQAGIADDKIIGTIHSTGSIYNLSSSDITDLKNAGVSQRVIDHMLQTAY